MNRAPSPVQRPSDAIEAKAATATAFTALFLGLAFGAGLYPALRAANVPPTDALRSA